MSCVVLMEARILPEKLDDCIKLLVENRLKDTKVYDGCETCYGSVDKDHSMVFMWSQWASVEHGKNISLGDKKGEILKSYHHFLLKTREWL